jgi:hypothetical protein
VLLLLPASSPLQQLQQPPCFQLLLLLQLPALPQLL